MSASEMKRSGIELGHCGLVGVASANARRSRVAISFKSREDIAAFICRETDAEKGARSGREERPESLLYSMGCSKTLTQKKDGYRCNARENPDDFPAHCSRNWLL